MVHNKTKHLTRGFVLFVISAILIIASFFSFSRAWFSNTADKKMTGNVAQLGVVINSSAVTPTNGNYVFDNSKIGSNFTAITLTSTSTIPVYARVKITANWATLDNEYEDVFDVIEFTLYDVWASLNTDTTIDSTKRTSNEIINNGFFYYKSRGSAIDRLTSNFTVDLIRDISLKPGKSMPANLVINIFAEVEQVNKEGLAAFGFTLSQ